MKHCLRLMVLAIIGVPSVAAAVDLGVDATTLIRLEERSVPGFNKEQVYPATQFLGIDLDKLGDGNLSFHLYGWGRLDLADKSTDEGSTDADLSYAYLAYRFPRADAQLKLGRFFVYEGVAAEQVDGISARTDLTHGFSASLFGGAPVKLDLTGDNKGDYVVGGRLAYRLAGILELGASALREGGITTGESTDLKDYRQLVGGDIWLAPFKMMEIRGHSNYNTATSGFAEHSYLVEFYPVRPLTIAAEYNDYRLKDYFATTNLRSLFNPDRDETLRSYGGSVTYVIAKPVEVTADYKRINYHRADRGNTNRYGGEVRLTLADRKVRAGVSYHRADSALSANSYHEARGYVMYRTDKYSASLDAIGHFYDEKVLGTRDTDYEVLGSLGYHLMDNLAVSGDVGYGRNPWYDEEVRGVIRLTYNFNYSSKGAAK